MDDEPDEIEDEDDLRVNTDLTFEELVGRVLTVNSAEDDD